MKKILVLPVILFALLTACSTAPNDAGGTAQAVSDVPRTVTEVMVAGLPVAMADLSVEGMTCEMMCGGAIKKALAKVQGVASTEIKFTEGDEADHAIVTYDPAQVTDADIVKAVQAIHEGQYKVSAIAITKQVQGSTAIEGEEGTAKTEAEVAAALPELVMPSILGFLTRMLRL